MQKLRPMEGYNTVLNFFWWPEQTLSTETCALPQQRKICDCWKEGGSSRGIEGFVTVEKEVLQLWNRRVCGCGMPGSTRLKTLDGCCVISSEWRGRRTPSRWMQTQWKKVCVRKLRSLAVFFSLVLPKTMAVENRSMSTSSMLWLRFHPQFNRRW